jgi:rRNA maturation endonuclease Nob1
VDNKKSKNNDAYYYYKCGSCKREWKSGKYITECGMCGNYELMPIPIKRENTQNKK